MFHSLGELGLVRSVEGSKAATEVVIAEPAAGHPAARELGEDIGKAVAAAGGAPAAVSFVKMTEAEEDELGARLRALAFAPAQATGNGRAPGVAASMLTTQPDTVRRGRPRDRTRSPTSPPALG